MNPQFFTWWLISAFAVFNIGFMCFGKQMDEHRSFSTWSVMFSQMIGAGIAYYAIH